MATKFAEVVLAITYRERDDRGTFRGGAMYILKNGLGRPWLGALFALLTALAAFGIGKPDQTLRAGPSLADDVWHQVVVTRDDASGEVALFIDGDEHGRGGAAVGERDSVQRLVVGRNQLQARLADVRIYDRVFTKAEVVELYQGK